MKKFIVIGLGNFGLNLAATLVENDCEVLGMDIDREVVQKAKDIISHAIIGDASNKEVLESLAIRDFDGAVISIGQDQAPSTLVALYIKEIGIPRIVVRALSEDHGKILRMIGVSDVIFPEKDMAVRVANRLALKNALDYLPISAEYGIVEVNAPKSFAGKSLKDLKISTSYGCQVIALRNPVKKAGTSGLTTLKIAPTALDIIQEGSVMIVVGKHEDIEKIQSLE
jgi:trk system potassium uptake protein TrkA